jgi:hypothetical protein
MNQAHTGEERKQADLAALKTIFSAIGLSEWAGAIYCSSAGDWGNVGTSHGLSLYVYLRDETTRPMLLESARHLRNTAYTEVSSVPDLTHAQRQEESELSAEMEGRNKDELTNEDVQKKLEVADCWTQGSQEANKNNRQIRAAWEGKGQGPNIHGRTARTS